MSFLPKKDGMPPGREHLAFHDIPQWCRVMTAHGDTSWGHDGTWATPSRYKGIQGFDGR